MRPSKRANAEVLGTIDPGAWITRLADATEQWVVNDLHEPDHPGHVQRRRRVREQEPGALIGDRLFKRLRHIANTIPGRVGLLAIDPVGARRRPKAWDHAWWTPHWVRVMG